VGLDEQMVAQAGAVLMIAFGLVMLVPQLSARFSLATAGVSARADAGMGGIEAQGWQGQFLGGLFLGAVWSPCVGPTLGGAIALASQGEELLRAFLIMVAFALGIGSVMVAIGYGARRALQARMGALRAFAQRSRAHSRRRLPLRRRGDPAALAPYGRGLDAGPDAGLAAGPLGRPLTLIRRHT
jgi:cytochrome c-type biogenesis protein